MDKGHPAKIQGTVVVITLLSCPMRLLSDSCSVFDTL